MSKQTAVRNQASCSHPEDALGVGHSKSVQKPNPAHLSQRENVDVDEALGNGGAKKHATRAHTGPQNQPGQERDSLNEAQINRIPRPVPGDAKEVPGGATKARRAGPHGKQIHVDGSNDAATGPKKVARIG
jgi:hypothetical protein